MSNYLDHLNRNKLACTNEAIERQQKIYCIPITTGKERHAVLNNAPKLLSRRLRVEPSTRSHNLGKGCVGVAYYFIHQIID